MLLLALAAAAAQPQPGMLKTFGDWTVGCDNGRACRAVALVPLPREERADYLLLLVDRNGGPGGRPSIRFSLDRPLSPAMTILRVDGRPVARFGGQRLLPLGPALAAMLGQGRRATLTDLFSRVLASASLQGAAAAFLYMDEQQRRLGTVGALVRRGRRADARAPAPLPRIVQPPESSQPPPILAPATTAALIGPNLASCSRAPSSPMPRVVRLDSRSSLVLIERPCDSGMYNLWVDAFIIDETGRATKARFDAFTGMNPERRVTNSLVNAGWDAATRRLSSFDKGRGLGDCGVRLQFAWDGARFRLAQREEMGECRGSVDYITTWRAAVTTGR